MSLSALVSPCHHSAMPPPPITPPWCVECCVLTADGDILTPGDDARYTDRLLFKALVGLRQLFNPFLATIKFLLSERWGGGDWGGGRLEVS